VGVIDVERNGRRKGGVEKGGKVRVWKFWGSHGAVGSRKMETRREEEKEKEAEGGESRQ
jgi:hypothetical protein